MCVDFCVVNLCDVDNPIKSHQISTILFSKKITNLSILVGEARDLFEMYLLYLLDEQNSQVFLQW